LNRGDIVRACLRLFVSLALLPIASGCSHLTAKTSDYPPQPGMANGSVYLDSNGNGLREEGEKGIPGVRVSNGREIVRSDSLGRFSLPVEDDTIVFVIKPTGMTTALDARNLPRFYYIHKPAGSPAELRYPAVPATGALPESIDFPLYPQDEEDRFAVLVLGDPQPRDARELSYFARDIVEELPDHEAAFGVILGDLVDDELSLLDPLTQMLGLVGIPWYNVLGNHDLNFDAPDDAHSDETFERVFGPSSYAFEYAHVHFLVLDDIYFHAASEAKGRGPGYDGWLTERQLDFVENYLAEVSAAERVVLLMHIPLVGRGGHQVPQREQLFRLLAGHPYTLSISAHSHVQAHHFLGRESGNEGPVHHHWNSGTTSGSWWTGSLDEAGIPHTTMRDGTPNGYSILSFNGSQYEIRFKAARRPASHQMNIYAPDVISRDEQPQPVVGVNVFAGSSRSLTEMRLVAAGSEFPGPWIEMTPAFVIDPAYEAAREREGSAASAALPRPLPGPNPSRHIWQAPLPAGLPPGSYWIEVRSRDLFDQVDRARRILRVE
jgi:hypothetical protein